MKTKRGKKREFGGYLESRGWYDAGVQRVVKKWKPKLKKYHAQNMSSENESRKSAGNADLLDEKQIGLIATDVASETIENIFLILRRCFEYQEKVTLELGGPLNCVWYFVVDLIQALNDLFDPENTAGWVVKMCGTSMRVPTEQRMPVPGLDGNPKEVKIRGQHLRPLTFKEMADAIEKLGGRKIAVKSLEKAAERLKLTKIKNNVHPSK